MGIAERNRGRTRRAAQAALLAVLHAACSGGDNSEASTDPDPQGSVGGSDVDPGRGGNDAGAGGNSGSDVNPTVPTGDPPPSLDDLAQAPADEVPWTILVYGHADHNLSNSLYADMLEMASAELDGTVQVVVLADWDASQAIAQSSPTAYFPEGLQLFAIHGGGASPELLAEAPETNLDDPAELTEIVRAVFSGLPSQRRGIVLWDHGGAWQGGFGGDTQNGTATSSTAMAPQAVAAAIRSGLEAAGVDGPRPLDFVAFDTCLMAGAEVAFPFRDLTDTYIAAAELDYGNGWDYQATFTHFAQNAVAPMSELATSEVSHWDAHHATASPSDELLRSHAALDLSQLGAFAAASAALTATMVESSTFDPLELGRSTFFALSPYASQFEQGSLSPGLRDIGQLLSGLAAVQSDTAVAEAASVAREMLDDLILASSQGSLRAGEQVGLHVEQTLGSNLSAQHLASYRTRASEWVNASRWDELLELASAASDNDPPVFDHAIINAEAASRAAPPVLQFTTSDTTAAKATVQAALETTSGSILALGLVGSGLIGPDVVHEFYWDGSLIGFSDGQPGMLDYWLDVAPGAAPVLSIPGLLGDGGAEPTLVYLVFGAAQSTANALVIVDGSRATTLSTSEVTLALPGATFTPVYLEYGAAAEPSLAPGDPLPIPPEGFTLYQTFMGPGSYFMLTAVADIWGNEGVEIDALTLTEALGP